MKQDTTIWVGLDVHKETIAMCSVLGDRHDEHLLEIANQEAAIRKAFKRLKSQGTVRACYEAGPCGYVVRRQLESMGVSCAVIAPSLIPRIAGNKIKTDRRDARKLVRLYRAGELTTIHVPTEADEAVRDLVRCREDLWQAIRRQQQWLLKFLLRHGRVFGETKNWSEKHWVWLRAQRFELAEAQRTFDEYLAQLDFTVDRLKALDRDLEAIAKLDRWKPVVGLLSSLAGIGWLSALTLATEVIDFQRFRSPRELMSFVGLIPGIHASGGSGKEGGRPITKMGNAHARRIAVEAAWHYYRRRPMTSGKWMKRAVTQPPWAQAIAVKAATRLHHRFAWLVKKGKRKHVAVVAVARELMGFVWALMNKQPPEDVKILDLGQTAADTLDERCA